MPPPMRETAGIRSCGTCRRCFRWKYRHWPERARLFSHALWRYKYEIARWNGLTTWKACIWWRWRPMGAHVTAKDDMARLQPLPPYFAASLDKRYTIQM